MPIAPRHHRHHASGATTEPTAMKGKLPRTIHKVLITEGEVYNRLPKTTHHQRLNLPLRITVPVSSCEHVKAVLRLGQLAVLNAAPQPLASSMCCVCTVRNTKAFSHRLQLS